MKKLNYFACVLFALLASCEQKDEITLAPVENITDTVMIKNVQELKKVDLNEQAYNIVYSHSFNNNTSGSYLKKEWQEDWNSPSWANNLLGYGKIVAEGKNKYMKESFPPGSFKAIKGYQWHGKFDKGYQELYFSYKVKFSSGFNSGKLHGKLPGLSGGSSNGGGNLPTGRDGWSARYMFHGTDINFYLYTPDIYKSYGDAKPVKGKKYYGKGPKLAPGYKLETEVWYTVTQRIVLNTPGKANGRVEGFINGKLCASQTGIRFRDIETLKIDRIYFANFFGGSGVSPSKTEAISFDDFVVYTYKNKVSVEGSDEASPEGTIISIPIL